MMTYLGTSVSGQYLAASAYKAQFFGTIPSDMKSMVWKIWAPPKIKHFACFALQNMLWMADRLERGGDMRIWGLLKG